MSDRIALSECIRQVIESTHEHQRAEADLDAQRDMAKWAWAVVVISAASLIVGIVGIYFIKRTFDKTVEAVRISEKAFGAEQRPWVEVSAPYIALTLGKDGVLLAYIEAKAQNIGKSPAFNVLIGCELVDTRAMLRMPQEDFYERELARAGKWLPTTTILPTGEFAEGHITHTPVDGAKWQEIDLRSLAIMVCVTYRYFDGEIGQTGHYLSLEGCEKPSGFEPPRRTAWQEYAKVSNSGLWDRVT